VTFLRCFSFKMFFICTNRDEYYSKVDGLALWKIISGEDAVLIPKNLGAKFSSGFLHLEFFGVG